MSVPSTEANPCRLLMRSFCECKHDRQNMPPLGCPQKRFYGVAKEVLVRPGALPLLFQKVVESA